VGDITRLEEGRKASLMPLYRCGGKKYEGGVKTTVAPLASTAEKKSWRTKKAQVYLDEKGQEKKKSLNTPEEVAAADSLGRKELRAK